MNYQNSDITDGDTTVESENDICPWCGNKLVLRTATKGKNAGNKFYGCSTFPKCRFIRNIKQEKWQDSEKRFIYKNVPCFGAFFFYCHLR